ncbi:MAG: helix-hairpin-helix domain-containing protein [Oscillospiraceae bacterium]|nr:helix-hairpin-helix domain-containing protein [Oscillospiraceae bacterium]
MRLLLHEKIAGGISILFIVLVFFFSVYNKNEPTVAIPANESSSPYLISINTANVQELDMLEGIGDKTAKNIIEYRSSHGAFKSLDELKRVSGIGQSTLDKIKAYIKL